MVIRWWIGIATFSMLFNTFLLMASAQSLQAVIAPPKGKDRAPMVEVPTGSFPMGCHLEIETVDETNTHVTRSCWIPF